MMATKQMWNRNVRSFVVSPNQGHSFYNVAELLVKIMHMLLFMAFACIQQRLY